VVYTRRDTAEKAQGEYRNPEVRIPMADNLKERIQEMNDLPDISGEDSPELKRLCEQSAREVKLVGSLSASTALEMIGLMRELEMKQRAGNHVAWCRYTYDESGCIESIATCDSDAKGAFKVYAAPQPPTDLAQHGKKGGGGG
jgi:hypothetical protein